MVAEVPEKVSESVEYVPHDEPGPTGQGNERIKLKATRRGKESKSKGKGKGKVSTTVEVMTPQPAPIPQNGICPPNTPGIWYCNQSHCGGRNWPRNQCCSKCGVRRPREGYAGGRGGGGHLEFQRGGWRGQGGNRGRGRSNYSTNTDSFRSRDVRLHGNPGRDRGGHGGPSRGHHGRSGGW